jgi:hypothetical protein
MLADGSASPKGIPMARPTVKQRTRTNLTQATPQAPQLDVVAPLDVHAAGGEGAAMLSKVLGMGMEVATPIYKQVQEKDAARGALDQQAGVVDSKKMSGSQAYNDAYTSAKARADFADKKKVLLDWYDKDFDKAKGTPQELDQHIVDFYRESYGTVDDSRVAKAVAGEMEEFRQAMLNRQTEVTRKAVTEEHTANISKIIEDSVNSGKTVDSNALKDQLAAVLGKPGAVRAYASIVGQLAIKKKDPGIIDALIPASWQDGTPGPGSIPEVASDLNQARYYASQQADAADSHARSEAKRLRDVKADAFQNEALNIMANGSDLTQAIEQNRSLLTPEEHLRMLNANETMKTRREKGDVPDPLKVSEIEFGLFSGQMSMSDVMEAVSQPGAPLGSGMELKQTVHSLLNTAKDAVEHIERMKTDTTYRFYADQLGEAMPIIKNPVDNRPTPTSLAERHMATARYHELVMAGGMSPPEAYSKVRAEIPKLNDSQSISFDARSAPNAAELTQALRIRRFTPEMKTKYQPKVIGQMFDQGDLTVEQAHALLDLYKH